MKLMVLRKYQVRKATIEYGDEIKYNHNKYVVFETTDNVVIYTTPRGVVATVEHMNFVANKLNVEDDSYLHEIIKFSELNVHAIYYNFI